MCRSSYCYTFANKNWSLRCVVALNLFTDLIRVIVITQFLTYVGVKLDCRYILIHFIYIFFNILCWRRVGTVEHLQQTDKYLSRSNKICLLLCESLCLCLYVFMFWELQHIIYTLLVAASIKHLFIYCVYFFSVFNFKLLYTSNKNYP